MGELRATQPAEKHARHSKILTAASDLLDRLSYQDITMEQIARQAGMAKGTLYLYFRTRESIFLGLFEQLLGIWYEELEMLASRATGTVEPAAAARVISSTLMAYPTLIHLHGILNTAIGCNVDHETAQQFRRRRHQRMTSLAAALSTRISGLSDARAFRFLVRLEAMIAGLSWASPSQTGPCPETSLTVIQIDFEDELATIATALLR